MVVHCLHQLSRHPCQVLLVECSNDAAADGRRTNRPDFSRMGNMSCWRNEAVDGTEFVFEESWILPSAGVLTLDYVSPRRCYADAKPISQADVEVGVAVVHAAPHAIHLHIVRRR